MDQQRLEILFQKYLNKTATDTERREFFELVREPGSDQLLQALSEKYPVGEDLLIPLPHDTSHQILSAVLASEKPAIAQLSIRPVARRRWMSYAAAVLLLVVAGTSYLFFHKTAKHQRQ